METGLPSLTDDQLAAVDAAIAKFNEPYGLTVSSASDLVADAPDLSIGGGNGLLILVHIIATLNGGGD